MQDIARLTMSSAFFRKEKLFVVAAFVCLCALAACSSVPKNATAQTDKNSKSLFYDRNSGTLVTIDTNGIKGDGVRHITPTTQETIVSMGTPFVIHYDSVPAGAYVAVKQIDPKSLSIVVQIRQLLAEHCESVVVYDTKILPMIINKSKAGCYEQVVLTPIFDQDCSMKGYQLRYGSRESGCTDAETESYMVNFKRCQCEEGQTPNVPVQRKAAPTPVPLNSKQVHIMYVNPGKTPELENTKGF